MVGTGKYIYADNLLGPGLRRTLRTDGRTWSTYCVAPDGMIGEIGPGTATHAASTDGVNWYVLAAMNNGGVWWYIEQE